MTDEEIAARMAEIHTLLNGVEDPRINIKVRYTWASFANQKLGQVVAALDRRIESGERNGP
jgi:hypothetical protein